MKFQPALPDWKVRALKQCETAVYNKIFVQFGDNARQFWDKTEWILHVDSNPVTSGDGQQSYTRGYYTVGYLKPYTCNSK